MSPTVASDDPETASHRKRFGKGGPLYLWSREYLPFFLGGGSPLYRGVKKECSLLAEKESIKYSNIHGTGP